VLIFANRAELADRELSDARVVTVVELQRNAIGALSQGFLECAGGDTLHIAAEGVADLGVAVEYCRIAR
jgi:alpha-D-ribose 1-methylphosphonate 5-triphosphate synthase subunit PhnL